MLRVSTKFYGSDFFMYVVPLRKLLLDPLLSRRKVYVSSLYEILWFQIFDIRKSAGVHSLRKDLNLTYRLSRVLCPVELSGN